MKGAVIYYTGTGNTEYVAANIKKEFGKRDVECSLFDVRRKKGISDEYDFFVFGSPIYAEMFPELYVNWVDKNISVGRGRRCMIFSTQADDFSPGVEELSRLLEKRGFEIAVKDCIKMPNNYFLGKYKKDFREESEAIKNRALEKVSFLVESFLKGERIILDVSTEKLQEGKEAYKNFMMKSKKWAKENITVDYDLCVKCGKCSKNCPTKNISMKDKINFASNCISCRRCIHNCPVNAFLYKGEHFDQYKL